MLYLLWCQLLAASLALEHSVGALLALGVFICSNACCATVWLRGIYTYMPLAAVLPSAASVGHVAIFMLMDSFPYYPYRCEVAFASAC